MAWSPVASAEFDQFEWDENKRRINLQRHAIDFRDAAAIFKGAVIVSRSDREAERRWRAIGLLNGREICVVYTERNDACRIISARRARTEEQPAYRALHSTGT